MTTYVPAKKNTEYIFYISLVSQSTGQFQANPTLAAGDFKVSKDGGALANLTTLPAVTPAASKAVKVTLSSTEMNADNVVVIGSDAAGAEWDDVFINIQTSVSQIDDLSARIPAALSGDGFMKADLKSIEDELTSGNNATLQLKQLNVSNSNGNAIRAVGGGAFEGVYIAAGDTANGITIDGGGTSGNGVSINANDGDGVVITAYGTFPNGIGIYSYGDAFGARFEGGKSIDAPQDIALPSGDLDDQLQAIDNFIDTEVTAIKAKTDQLTFTIANQVDSNVLTGGGSGLDAAGTRAALGLASANLDTQLGDLPTNAELATALGTADDAVLAQVALVKTETDKIASVKAKTDSLTFTTAGQVDANVQSVNDTELTGDGSAVPWGPA
jgi:hypothetical protein